MAASMSMGWPGPLFFKEPEIWTHSGLMVTSLMPIGATTRNRAMPTMSKADLNGRRRGRHKYEATLPFSSRPPMVPACTVDEANMEEPASTLAGQPTTNQSTAGDCTRPSTAATAQHYCTYKSEEEVEDDGREFHAASRLAPSAAVQILWRPAVSCGDADVHGALHN